MNANFPASIVTFILLKSEAIGDKFASILYQLLKYSGEILDERLKTCFNAYDALSNSMNFFSCYELGV